MIAAGALTLAALSFFWSMYFFLEFRNAKKGWAKEIDAYYEVEKKRKSVLVLLGEKFDRTDYAKSFQVELQKIGIKLTPSEFYGILIFGAGFIAYGLSQFIGIPMIFAMLLAIGSIEGIKRAVFLFRKAKYQQLLEQSLSEVCRLLSNGARPGLSIQQGIELVGKEAPYPANVEFIKLSRELQLGVSLEHVLENFQNKYQSRDLNILIATLQVQKEAGGNLAAALNEMSQTLDERKILKQMVKTLTAEQKYVAMILPFMPVFIVLLMNAIIDGFIDPLFTPVGFILLAIFGTGVFVGFILIQKVTKIRV